MLARPRSLLRLQAPSVNRNACPGRGDYKGTQVYDLLNEGKQCDVLEDAKADIAIRGLLEEATTTTSEVRSQQASRAPSASRTYGRLGATEDKLTACAHS